MKRYAITNSGRCLSRLLTARVVLTWLLVGITPVLAADQDDVTTASNNAAAKVSQALLDEDAQKLASIFSDDGAIIVPSGQMIRGRLTIKASASLLFMTMGGGKLKINRSNISILDSNAYETGRYTFHKGEGDAQVEAWNGSYTIVWLFEEGQWKVDRLIGLK